MAPFHHELTFRRFALRSALPIAVAILLATTFLVGPFGFAAEALVFWLLLRRL